MKENKLLSDKIEGIVSGFKSSDISIAVIDLKSAEPRIAGCNLDVFMYPASIYKVFIAAEVLRQIHIGERRLEDIVSVTEKNVVEDETKLFSSSIHVDGRPVLLASDTPTLDTLLNLMLTRSDNTSANVLIDVVGRENINKNIIQVYGWNGSDVTRKFLNRLKEDTDYKDVQSTVTSARHLAEFFYLVERGMLVNVWVSNKLKGYLRERVKQQPRGLSLGRFDSYYRKAGWFEISAYGTSLKDGIKRAYSDGYAILKYYGDAGVVKGKKSHYAIAVLTVTKTRWPWVSFPMAKLSRKIHNLMELQ